VKHFGAAVREAARQRQTRSYSEFAAHKGIDLIGFGVSFCMRGIPPLMKSHSTAANGPEAERSQGG